MKITKTIKNIKIHIYTKKIINLLKSTLYPNKYKHINYNTILYQYNINKTTLNFKLYTIIQKFQL